MPKLANLEKVLVIGSGPIVIGQAAEFDYAGTQACKALKEEGLEVILVNSNPATIMTDSHMADKIYIEPLTCEFLTKIIAKEKPDGLLPTLGGQTGLNLAVELSEKGILEEYGVKLLGTSLEAIKKAEDRELFKETMEEIGQPVPESTIISSWEEAKAFAEKIGFPIIVRPAYTLGGTGGGLADNMVDLEEIVSRGLKNSRIGQALLERSVAGWKEIEYEVMRDSGDNCIIVCNMENFDPVGIHTGDSIVVAPSQTLTDKEYQMLRTASIEIIRSLKIAGGCNVQYALDTESMRYYVIEVNPRVSRSSALASKATGYPIAKIAAKIAVGYTLDELTNPVTGKTSACFEPALDYVVTKIPRWPFDKFAYADRTLGTQMKATGEVMSIGRTIEESLMKAIRSLEVGVSGLWIKAVEDWDLETLKGKISKCDDERLFSLAEAMRRGIGLEEINALSGIDLFFLNKLKNLVEIETQLKEKGLSDLALVKAAKEKGFSDKYIAFLTGKEEKSIREIRKEQGLTPVYKIVDTCAAEFEAGTPYYYSTYETEDEVEVTDKKKVLVIGSGPIRIGQGIEFDYCSVHSVWALKEEGCESIIINNNPETVSTDFDTSDKLYFEPLSLEDVMHIIDKEKPEGVIVQFGGQTSLNLAWPLAREGVKILGTTVEDIDRAEDREKFDQVLEGLGIERPKGGMATSLEEAEKVAAEIGYPVLVRPSYVLGGRAMEIIYKPQELKSYMKEAVKVSPDRPILVDKYLEGKEIEVDAISDGTDVLIPGITEHIERAGVHSGDSLAVYPTQTVEQRILDKVVDYTTRLARGLNIKGVFNIQYVVHEGEVYVIEVNPRASRTVPYLSKVTGVPMVTLATKIMLGHTLKSLGYETGLWPFQGFVAIKAPVFSFEKLLNVDISLGPEMKSTGEVLGYDRDYTKALYKAMVGSGLEIPQNNHKCILVTIADRDKEEALPIIKGFAQMGFCIYATAGTSQYLKKAGIPVRRVNKVRETYPTIVDLVREDKISLVINTLTKGKVAERDGFKIRRLTVEHDIACLTSLDTAREFLKMIELIPSGKEVDVYPLQKF